MNSLFKLFFWHKYMKKTHDDTEPQNTPQNTHSNTQAESPSDSTTDKDENFAKFVEMYNNLNKNNLCSQILNFIQKLEFIPNDTNYDLYKKICDEIAYIPTINDILQLEISFDKKTILIEQIVLLHNAQPLSIEFFDIKKFITSSIKNYKKYMLEDINYDHYEQIIESLQDVKTINKSLEHRILDSNFNIKDKSFIYEKYKSIIDLKPTNPHTYTKMIKWIECVLELPSIKHNLISYDDSTYEKGKYLYEIKSLLDHEIYGLQRVKEHILFLLNNKITNPNSPGLNLALSGPPGTAKTSIINFLARATNLPFFQVNAAGIKNSDYLLGHNFTYEGSGPGCIVQALHSLACKNGIIYFDEFDKISSTDHGIEISRALLHITDSTQNSKFHDHYVGEQFDIDLSSIWFAYSLNDRTLIDTTLQDRISIIEIEGYTTKEKFIIAKKYLLPKIIKNIGLEPDSVTFDDDCLYYIIEISSVEKSGVRQIKHKLEEIIMKINLLITVSSTNTKKSIRHSKFITPKVIHFDLSFNIVNFRLPIILTKKDILDLKITGIKQQGHLSMYA
jgi:ATP-dependent Lon protease